MGPVRASRMPEQLPLAGFDAAPKPTDRLFFALFPDADAAARIARRAEQLWHVHGLKGKPLAPERLHVTLHHLGDYAGLPPDIVAKANQAAATVVVPPFELGFDRTMSFLGRPNKRPFVLRGVDGIVALTAFQQVLGTALTQVGLGRWAEPHFTPHVTLLYDDLLIAEQPVEPIAWTAHEFVRVHSLLGQGVHLPLARWPLRA